MVQHCSLPHPVLTCTVGGAGVVLRLNPSMLTQPARTVRTQKTPDVSLHERLKADNLHMHSLRAKSTVGVGLLLVAAFMFLTNT
jgi:hypothetical protein